MDEIKEGDSQSVVSAKTIYRLKRERDEARAECKRRKVEYGEACETLARMHTALLSVEWRSGAVLLLSEEDGYCPACGFEKPEGHAVDPPCNLAQALAGGEGE